ncbi:hypothetical protein VP01_1541g2 [Puccinia sorghi]|uniref:Uncharacterized protein n=1 Tax=Puccinia sorghi TaxID=27349 RepID=A0A0L6VK70_9BASI|nr:hypothetical protein VP01_1541g2 [Puccinia sorghi]
MEGESRLSSSVRIFRLSWSELASRDRSCRIEEGKNRPHDVITTPTKMKRNYFHLNQDWQENNYPTQPHGGVARKKKHLNVCSFRPIVEEGSRENTLKTVVSWLYTKAPQAIYIPNDFRIAHPICSERTKGIQCALTTWLPSWHYTMDYRLYNPQPYPYLTEKIHGSLCNHDDRLVTSKALDYFCARRYRISFEKPVIVQAAFNPIKCYLLQDPRNFSIPSSTLYQVNLISAILFHFAKDEIRVFLLSTHILILAQENPEKNLKPNYPATVGILFMLKCQKHNAKVLRMYIQRARIYIQLGRCGMPIHQGTIFSTCMASAIAEVFP